MFRDFRFKPTLFLITFSLCTFFQINEACARRRVNSADFARIFSLSFPKRVFNTSSINPGFASAFDPFGFGRFASFNSNFRSFNNDFSFAHNPSFFSSNPFAFRNLSGFGGGSHLATGALDPSLVFANNVGSNLGAFGGASNFNNFFDPIGLNGFNNFGFNNNFVNARGRRFFADTAGDGGNSSLDSGSCGNLSITNICSPDAVQKNAQTERAVKRPTREMYEAANNFDLNDIVEKQRETAITNLYRQGVDGEELGAAINKLKEVKVITSAEQLDSWAEKAHFQMMCGIDNLVNNAFACPFHGIAHNKIYVCKGRVLAALTRAEGDVNRAKADFAQTIAHEIGHMFGPEKESPLEKTGSKFAACEMNKGVTSADVISEKAADLQGSLSLAANIAEGQTDSLDPQEYVARAGARLCGTPKTKDHPSGEERLAEMIKVIRLTPGAREKIPGCTALSASESTCTLRGLQRGEL